MRINHNMNALNALNNLNINNNKTAAAMEKLSSGLRINTAADDAAGLSISEKMKSQVRGLHQASRNAQDGISMIQTGEGALASTEAVLQRMRELSVEASNGTYVSKDRAAINTEMNQLKSEITRVATQTQFNTQKLIDDKGLKTQFQVGANENETISVNFSAATATKLGVDKVDVKDATVAGKSITTIDAAIQTISTQRSNLGAVQNRLSYAINNADNAANNLTAAQSRITDVNMAQEMVTFTKNNILQQAAQAMLGQANQQPQSVLQLLR